LPSSLPTLDLIGKIITIKGHNTSGSRAATPHAKKTAVDFVINGLDEGTLKAIIDRVLAFDEIIDAHRCLEAGEQIGKIVAAI
jgi:NADPH:quinone reductase-like Zn-dependent oxidoreductase